MKDLSNYPDLPALTWIKKQLRYLGGDVLIVGLTQKQADEIMRLARDNGITSATSELHIETEHPLSADTRSRLRNKGLDAAEDSMEIHVGSTVDCEKPLLGLLGIS
jgi:hypothetical protein